MQSNLQAAEPSEHASPNISVDQHERLFLTEEAPKGLPL